MLPSVLHYLESHAHADPGRPLILDAGGDLSYSEVRSRARALADSLRREGVGAGDRVVLWLPNSPEWVIVGLAVQYAGAIVVPINTRWTVSEAAYILEKTRARAVVASEKFLGRDYLTEIESFAGEFPSLELFISVDGDSTRQATVASLIDQGCASDPAIDAQLNRVAPGDTSDIMFTSGTTGLPKGAKITHGSTLAAILGANERLLLRPDDRQLIVNPFFHMFGYKHGWSYCVVIGASFYPEPVFDPARAADIIEKFRVTVFSGPPTLFESLMALPDFESRDFSTLRFSLTGATNVPPDTVRKLQSALGIDHVANGYGLTESTACGTHTSIDDDIEVVATTTGRPLDVLEFRIVGPDGAMCDVDEPGEIEIRGPVLMSGYFEDDAATAATIDADGWLHTGDIGAADAAGNIRIVGRLKEVIIVGGFNVYPAEVERVLNSHPSIASSAVVGVPDDRLGEVPVAYLEVTEPLEGMEKWCRERLANYKQPREFILVDQMPRNAMGKIVKSDLQKCGA
ncbi:AMP-binding protein [Aeromicrobium wangtongii]|uniref:AMP-binding protein n=1 Tax=Aeromicrobium wangtongii TaxID=2969247 RepID=A0ABY5ME57_9ACTN|nr:AMP-binding protein [Aeromicrobium wangtongii]MCD9196980.1 AMP-binding protein [Aeromicrobium wangtongii]UUP15481.1 AMP-binding protein [Aeromicrobium wangtongii]